jgi:processive 1,2-diacylglycerol beta-glucosyltransferase
LIFAAMPENPTVLILTAGFGDGHNSAARSLAEALDQESGGRIVAVVVDLFEDAAPVTGAFYKWIYRQMITYLPFCWKCLFKASQHGNFHSLWWDRFVGVGPALQRRLKQHQPSVIVLTYPVYPYFLEQQPPDALPAVPVFMAITDSITIHPIWLQGKVDRLYVTDPLSRVVVLAGQHHPVPVEVSGFPVAPGFAAAPRRDPDGRTAACQENPGRPVGEIAARDQPDRGDGTASIPFDAGSP